MLRRKVLSEFDAFLRENRKEALLVTGARQVGKTYSIRDFAKRNFVAQELRAHGFEKVFYFNSKKHGEVDFLIERDGAVLPIEAKSGRDHRAHTALDNLLAAPAFGLDKALVLNANGDCATCGKVVYRPVYATMFLKRNPLPERLIYRVDLSALGADGRNR